MTTIPQLDALIDVLAVDAGPDVRTGVTARVVVAAYRRWQSRPPRHR
jgi:hypothetical protein